MCVCFMTLNYWDMFFVVRSNDSFKFPLGWIKYIVTVIRAENRPFARIRASFSPEILQAGAVKGLNVWIGNCARRERVCWPRHDVTVVHCRFGVSGIGGRERDCPAGWCWSSFSSPSFRFRQVRLLLKCCFTSVETVVLLYVHRNRRFTRDVPGRPPRLSHSSWAMVYRWMSPSVYLHFRPKLAGCPRIALPSLFFSRVCLLCHWFIRYSLFAHRTHKLI